MIFTSAQDTFPLDAYFSGYVKLLLKYVRNISIKTFVKINIVYITNNKAQASFNLIFPRVLFLISTFIQYKSK